MADQVVSADEILRSSGAEQPVSEGTYLQRTGLHLAGWVGAVATIVILMLVIKWVKYAPPVPNLANITDQSAAKAILENYKLLQQIVMEQFTTLFDSIVVKVLLPIFTSILGYIFGSRTNGDTTRQS
jgi:hypothetical protein